MGTTRESAEPRERALRFGPYRFHPRQGLTRNGRRVAVTPKSLGVLNALLERAGEIVTKDEIFRTVWRGADVSDAALTSCIQELRRALRDSARSPRYIETHHRRGFRFLVELSPDESLARTAAAPFVGRDTALRRLSESLELVRAGARQIVFVTGEAGIGKTTLVGVFLAGVAGNDSVLTSRAECVEHYGAGEAYHPLLEALTRLCKQSQGASSIATLRRYAPSWLAQLPGLQKPGQRTALERRAAEVTRGRMLRELSDALEAIAARVSLVLCIEDLQWSDASTLEWILSFAHRQDPARILLVATLRTGESHDSARSAHELIDNARLRGLASEIALARLDLASVIEYVERRFSPGKEARAPIEELAGVVHQRSEGNPLFIVNILNDLTAQDALPVQWDHGTVSAALDRIRSGIPADIRGSIEQQTERLAPAERELVEVASLLSAPCSAAAIAAGADVSIREVETSLGLLARRGAFLRNTGEVEWPDGTVSAVFEFLHALYREVLSARVSPGNRARVHERIGMRLEEAYGPRAAEIAAQLAVHFDRARDYSRAVSYLQRAAEADQRRNAHDGAERHLRHALALLEKLPHSVERDEREIALRIGLGDVVMQLSGWAAPDVEQAFVRARELGEKLGLPEPVFAATGNLWVCAMALGYVTRAMGLADTLLSQASRSADNSRLLQAYHAHWTTCFALGDFRGVELHTGKGIELPEHSHGNVRAFGSHDANVCARAFRARAAALRGQRIAASESAHEAVAAARALDHKFTLAFALMHSSATHLDIGNIMLAQEHAELACAIAEEHGFGLIRAWAACFRGSSLFECGHVDEGLCLMHEALAEARALRTEAFQPHLLSLLAKGQLGAARFADAQRSIGEALQAIERSGERTYLAELQRLQAELRLASGTDHDGLALVEAELRESLETARRQGAQLLADKAAARIALLSCHR